MPIEVYIESGPRKVFASALRWPGWARSDKTEELALETLDAYRPRYAVVTREAGMRFAARTRADFEVVDRLTGGGATDFGVLNEIPAADREPLTTAEAARLARLVDAAWVVFDRVVAGAPPVLRKGPRGGGRDRDPIVAHVVGAEASYARSLGLRLEEPEPGDSAAIEANRAAIAAAIRSPVERDKGWPVPYAARRVAWHVLDHAWEIEDKSDEEPSGS